MACSSVLSILTILLNIDINCYFFSQTYMVIHLLKKQPLSLLLVCHNTILKTSGFNLKN